MRYKQVADLTPKQRDILTMVGDGYTDKEIARTLERSVSTIKNTMVIIYDKLKVRNRAQAGRVVFGKN